MITARRATRYVLAGLVLCGLAAAAIPVAGQVRVLVGTRFEARIVSIVDGDTVDAVPLGSKGTIRVRLHGIDAPERGEPFSSVATKSTRVLLFDQRVSIEGRDVDRYGRLVARISVLGEDASTALLEAGLACHYVKYSSDVTLAKAEAEARSRGRGFWGAGAEKPRCTTMSPQATETKSAGGRPVIFHGNTSSRVYHSPSCRNYKCRNCTQAFHSEADARAAGFQPAGDCLSKSSQAR